MILYLYAFPAEASDVEAASPASEDDTERVVNQEANAVGLCCLHMVQFVLIGSFLLRAITPPNAFCLPSVRGDRWPPRAHRT